MLKNKKAAMFGLDARIALAIFGALSVITGASLYSAIEQSRVVAIVTEASEISKAIESYMLDIGSDLPGGTIRDYQSLVTNIDSNSSWSGPYLTYESGSNPNRASHPKYGNIIILDMKNTTGGATVAYVCSASPCYYWIRFRGLPLGIPEKIDEYVDGELDDVSGRIKIIDIEPTSVHFRGPLRINQP